MPAGIISNTPLPTPPMARAMASSSSSAANVPGTGAPHSERWPIVRDVEKPSAPASMASATRRAWVAMSSAVASSLATPRSPIT